MAKTILLTGATGFIGSHLLEALLHNGYKVVIVKRTTSNTWRIKHLLDKVKIYDTDIIPLRKAFEEQSIDTVVHMAAFYRKLDKDEDVLETIASNVDFPFEILEIGIRNGLRSFINTGTFFEYNCSSLLPVTENTPTKAFNFYAKTKIAFETILKTYSEQLDITTLRLFSPYGPKDNEKIVTTVIKKALSKEKIILSDGLQRLDFIYIKDIVAAFILAINKSSDQQIGYKVYNIGSGIGISIREIVSIIEQYMETTINKTWGPPSNIDIKLAVADINQAKSALGWFPEYSIHQGLNETIIHYKQWGLEE